MNYLILAICLYWSTATCQAQVLPLKNNYSTFPFHFSVKDNYDSTWNILVNAFSQNGFSIYLKSRADSLIISEVPEINWTYEKKGKLEDSTAIIVVPMYHNKSNSTTYPEPKYHGILKGELNITLESKVDSITITINRLDVLRAVYDIKDGNTKYVPFDDYKSTGVLEKYLSNFLQKHI